MQIRAARAHDAQALSDLSQRAFRETFFHYAPADLDRFLSDRHGVREFTDYLSDSARTVLLAEEKGNAIAYASFGAYHLPLPPQHSNIIELHRLYVLKDWQGKKLGAQLMQHAFNAASAQKAEAMYLGVWEGNVKAQEFYKRYGFSKIGEYGYEPIGPVVDREWVMCKELGS